MGVWYRAGTVAVTSDSKTVTGTGTQWQNLIFGVAPGVTFYGPDGKPYEIDTVNSNTSLTLATNYSGATASGQAYAIDPTRSGSVASLAAQTSEVLKFSQGQFTQIQNWFTGAASADVTLTSPAGQQITVPSYSKVTSEGEGQAARAKTEADKAAASAALAGDIVVASALPLPDVWAPLTDSLRLFTGYGREVKVGEDVVSQMVNFSRSTTATYIGKDGLLRTAAVNEPRFEAEGLLVEGQSTNLVPLSEGWPSSIGATAGNAWSHTSKDAAGWITVSGGTDAGSPEGSYRDFVVGATIQGKTTTFSFDVKKVAGYKFQVTMFIGGAGSDGFGMGLASFVDGQAFPSTPGLTVKDMGTWLRISITRKFGDGLSIIRLYPFGSDPGSNGALTYRRVQVEIQPFASSYIPTNGAAATRAADVCWIQNALNVGPDAPVGDTAINFALAFESDFKRTTGITAPSIFGIAPSANLLASQRRASLEDDGTLSLWCGAKVTYGIPGRGVAVICKRGAESICSYNGSIKKAPFINGYAGSHLALETGHVRNIRIWLNALTDEQIKAIK